MVGLDYHNQSPHQGLIRRLIVIFIIRIVRTVQDRRGQKHSKKDTQKFKKREKNREQVHNSG